MPVSNKKQKFEQQKLNCSMSSECVRTDSILPRGADLERVDFLAFSFRHFGLHFAPILLRFILLSSSLQGLKYFVTDFFNFDLRKKLCSVKADQVG